MIRVRVAALVVEKRAILLARHVKDLATSFLLPGGGVDDAEDARAALRRELLEEASVACDVGELRCVVETIAPDASRHLVQLVFDTTLRGPIGPSSDPRVVACEWHPVEALLALPLHPAAGKMLFDLAQDDAARAPRYLLAPWL